MEIRRYPAHTPVVARRKGSLQCLFHELKFSTVCCLQNLHAQMPIPVIPKRKLSQLPHESFWKTVPNNNSITAKTYDPAIHHPTSFWSGDQFGIHLIVAR
jgi:hypothetical protein